MEPSQALNAALDQARADLSRNPRGELTLPFRQRIWASMGSLLLDDSDHAVRGEGLIRRTNLAISCAQKVLPAWTRLKPNDHQPQDMIQIAQQYLQNRIDLDSATSQKEEFWTVLDDLSGQPKLQEAVYAGYSANKTVATATFDEMFEPDEISNESKDGDLDPYEWDASFYASLSFAGGAPWEKNSDAGRRKSFWEWYLQSAVPAAWKSA
jgi:hypothetical protein